MKSLVIFDSNFGSTGIIANIIAKELGIKAISVSNINKDDLNNINLMIIGSPIIGWKPSERMEEFLAGLESSQLKGVSIATFDTRVKLFIHGDAMGKIADSLTSLGANKIIDSMAFYVKGKEGGLFDGETNKALLWAAEIKKRVESK